MKPATSKAKGRRLQVWVRDLILELFPILEPDDVKSTAMGQNGEDVQLSPAARKLLPISVECKSYKTIAVYNWYDQAVQNAPKGMEPIVVMKTDRRKPLVLMDAETYFKEKAK